MNNEQIADHIYVVAEILEGYAADPEKVVNHDEMHEVYLMLHMLADELSEL